MYIKENIKSHLPIKNLSNIYVVADFDRTITKGTSQTSWSILANSPYVPKEYIKDRQNLYNHYRPIELDETMELSKKTLLMKEWFQKHIELFVKYKINKEIFKNAVNDTKIMEFRSGAKEFIEFLYKNDIPLIIISAGIGNFIEIFLESNNCYYNNVFVMSNKIIFKDNIAVGVENNIIHSLNKNEVALPKNIQDKLSHRNNVILLGDQISDLKMVDKSKHDVVYTTCLLADEEKDNISKIKENFDIVCEYNDDYFDLQDVLF